MKLADYLLENPLYGQGQQTLKQGTQTTPVLSWQEGLARALQGGVGGLTTGVAMGQAQNERGLDSKALADALESFGKGDLAGATKGLASRPNLSDTAAQLGMSAGMLGYKQKLEVDQQAQDAARFGFPTPGMQAARPVPQGDAGGYGSAIAGIESGGQPNGGYGAIGPETGKGRAHGKYQVMDFNVAPWTKEVLGQEMTPQQFLQNPQAQDAVFKAKFGQLVEKHGPEGASRAWFAGEGGMNNPNARDVNGMTPDRYGQQFAQNLGGQQPGGDTVSFQGLQLPRSAITTALAIRDHAERQKAILSVVTDAVKFQREGAPVERIRQADGSEKIVPRTAAVGMTSAQNVPPEGSKEGDVDALNRIAPDDPRYAQAYNRLSQPTMSQNGQLMYPDMSAYKPPAGAASPQQGVQFRDTPMSQFQMSGKLADDFSGNKVVKEYQEVAPVIASMRDAVGRNTKAADLNLIYGAAKVMDPGSVVREGEMLIWKNTQSLPDWMKQTVAGWSNGSAALSPVARERLMQEAESRFNALKAQRDQIAGSYGEKSKRYGLNPEDVTGSGAAPQQQQGPPAGGPPAAAVRRYDPATGRLQ